MRMRCNPLRCSTLALAALLLSACSPRHDATSIAATTGVPDIMVGATAYSPQRPTAQNGATRRVAVAAHAFVANSAGTDSPVLTTPPLPVPQGALVLVQALTQTPATLQAIHDSSGNVYRRIGAVQTYSDQKAGSVLYVSERVQGGPALTWSLVKAQGHGADEASLYVVVLSGARGIGAWGFSNTAPYGLRTPLTTTAANSVVVSFWGPADYSGSARDPLNPYVAPPGWTLGGQNDNGYNQCSGAYAWIRVGAAGTVLDPQWSSKKSVQANGSMWLVEARP